MGHIEQRAPSSVSGPPSYLAEPFLSSLAAQKKCFFHLCLPSTRFAISDNILQELQDSVFPSLSIFFGKFK